MKDKEFDEMIKDFDGFMRKHGYYTAKELADLEFKHENTLRRRIRRGIITDAVMINGVYYIPYESRGGTRNGDAKNR